MYPLPVVEKIADTKHDEAYTALILENEYLAVTILPQIGGKIHRAYDKTNGYDFIYHNHVIKRALRSRGSAIGKRLKPFRGRFFKPSPAIRAR